MEKTDAGIWRLLALPRGSKSTETGKFALAISGQPEVQDALAESLPPGWTVLYACDLAHAMEILSTCEIPIVLLDRDTPVLEWRDAVNEARRGPVPLLRDPAKRIGEPEPLGRGRRPRRL